MIKVSSQIVEKQGEILFREGLPGLRKGYLGLPSCPWALSSPEVQQVAEEAASGASISLLTHRHQKKAMAQEGHVSSRHVREVKGY